MRDSEASVRVAAAEALATLALASSGGEDAVAALADALGADSDPDVRYQAARGLSALGGDAVAARLIDALNAQQPPDDDATLRILEILGGLQFVKHPALGETIKRYFDHTDEAIAETARWAYGRLSQQ
jgi:HEAT repeat protein